MGDIEALFETYLNGEITAKQGERLAQWLTADEQHRSQFVSWVLLYQATHDALNSECGIDIGEDDLDVDFPSDKVKPRLLPWLGFPVDRIRDPKILSMTIAAILTSSIVVVLSLLSIPKNALHSPVAQPSNGSAFVGKLVDSYRPQWVEGEPTFAIGTSLVPGQRLRLAGGTIKVALHSGASVLISGETTAHFLGINHVALQTGKVCVYVPPQAIGFRLATSVGDIIDLGTEFGVYSDKQRVQVDVFKGAVELRPKASQLGPAIRLEEGRQISLALNGTVDEGNNIEFVRRLPSSKHKIEAELLAFYPFENNADDASGNRLHATNVSNIQFADGYEGRSAQFGGRIDSFIDIPINVNPTRLPVMSWGAWIRLANTEIARREILSSDNLGFDRTITLDHRGTLPPGTKRLLRYAVFASPSHGVVPMLGVLPEAKKWTFVAAVYDDPAQTVAFYVEDPTLNNGQGGLVEKRIGNIRFEADSTEYIRIGMHASGISNEPFSGEIDNVFIFRGKLKKTELEGIRLGGVKKLLSM